MVEKPLVLLADDNEATCTLITALLQNEFSVEIASNGNEAIEKLKARKFAAVLLDLLMPIADGYAVLDFLSSERPDVLPRVLVVTASLSAAQMQRVRTYRIKGVVAKPFEVDALYGAVRDCANQDSSHSMRGPLLASGMILMLAAELVKRV
ncbi:MAG TPA: response regulator [Thermoanaerobaculia bacterium]|nr:response regulator [Thermoanaerobaculia bacterium]